MGILDSLFGRKNTPVEDAQALLKNLRSQITDAEKELSTLLTRKKDLIEQYKAEALKSIRDEKISLQRENDAARTELSEIKNQVVELNEAALMQSFALYQPLYDFANVEDYRRELERIRSKQKELLTNDAAATGNMNWTVNGSAMKGLKMIRDTQKLLLRAFNSECEFVTWKVRYNNFDSCKKRIDNARKAITKLGATMNIEITDEYYDLKIKELHLALEYQRAREREKERQRELRERQREEAALLKEMEAARIKLEKEQAHYSKALAQAQARLAAANPSEQAALAEKISELEEKTSAIAKNLSDLDYRAANQRAGYVYIISNIGSFGEGVYKIGMTRRLEPQERIDELGGASVPFKFDVHAMIFTDDAPKLEAALHKAFDDRKLNLINTRREFFRVSLAEIEQVVRANYDKSVEFVQLADAEQFRESERIRAIKNAK